MAATNKRGRDGADALAPKALSGYQLVAASESEDSEDEAVRQQQAEEFALAQEEEREATIRGLIKTTLTSFLLDGTDRYWRPPWRAVRPFVADICTNVNELARWPLGCCVALWRKPFGRRSASASDGGWSRP